MKKLSAGILVYRLKSGQVEVLIAHMGGPWWAKKDAGAWSIPKGEYAEDEEALAAAKREFKEELGYDVPGGRLLELGSVEQKSGKVVSVWAVEGDLDAGPADGNKVTIEWPPRSGSMQEFPEVDRTAWFGLNPAAKKLIPAQSEFLQRLAQKLGAGQPAADEAIQASLF